MELKYLKEVKCPICECNTVIKEEIEKDNFRGGLRQHVNGAYWESRKFSCGQLLEFVPNYMATESNKYQICTNNEGHKDKIVKREKAKKDIIKYIEGYEDVDGSFRDEFLSRVQYISV